LQVSHTETADHSYGIGVSLAGSSGGSVDTGGGGLVGGGGCVGKGVEVGRTMNVGVADRMRVTGMDVNGADVGKGASVTGTNVKGVRLAGPEGVLVVVCDCVPILIGVLLATGVAATGRGVVPQSKNPRQ